MYGNGVRHQNLTKKDVKNEQKLINPRMAMYRPSIEINNRTSTITKQKKQERQQAIDQERNISNTSTTSEETVNKSITNNIGKTFNAMKNTFSNILARNQTNSQQVNTQNDRMVQYPYMNPYQMQHYQNQQQQMYQNYLMSNMQKNNQNQTHKLTGNLIQMEEDDQEEIQDQQEESDEEVEEQQQLQEQENEEEFQVVTAKKAQQLKSTKLKQTNIAQEMTIDIKDKKENLKNTQD